MSHLGLVSQTFVTFTIVPRFDNVQTLTKTHMFVMVKGRFC